MKNTWYTTHIFVVYICSKQMYIYVKFKFLTQIFQQCAINVKKGVSNSVDMANVVKLCSYNYVTLCYHNYIMLL